MMDPQSTVTHNEWIVDRLGNKRQFDVVIRGHAIGLAFLGIIECKDHERRKGPSDVEAFAKKTEHVNANFRLMISRMGFTEQALRLARHEDIHTLSLLTPSRYLNLGVRWYGRSFTWEPVGINLGPIPTFKALVATEVLHQDIPLINFVAHHLSTTYVNHAQEGNFQVLLDFDPPLAATIRTEEIPLRYFHVFLNRVCRKKICRLPFSMDGFFDWQKAALRLPPKPKICVSFNPDMQGWDDFDGEFPVGSVVVNRYWGHKWGEGTPVPDLLPLCTMRCKPALYEIQGPTNTATSH